MVYGDRCRARRSSQYRLHAPSVLGGCLRLAMVAPLLSTADGHTLVDQHLRFRPGETGGTGGTGAGMPLRPGDVAPAPAPRALLDQRRQGHWSPPSSCSRSSTACTYGRTWLATRSTATARSPSTRSASASLLG